MAAKAETVPVAQSKAPAVMRGGNSPTIGVAFGGGGARGLAHLHVMQVLDEMGLHPDIISGTSIGSLMGAGYAAGMRGTEVEEFFFETFDNRRALFAKLWQLRPGSVAEFMRNGGPRVGEVNIEKVMDVFLPDNLPETFEDLNVPFSAVATNYYGQCETVFNSGPLRPALAASAAIPAIFRPMMMENTVFIDGGMTNPLPFDLLQGKADIVIAVDVVGGPDGDPGKRPGKIDLMFGSSQLMMQSITSAKMKMYEPDIMLRPNVGAYRVMDFLKARKIMVDSEHIREELRTALDAAITFFQQNGGEG